MASVIPITLVGDNLGLRHRHLNSLVSGAYQGDEQFQAIETLSEQSAVDRLFKIELASKLRNVDYIITCLKDNDMLYVSRAMKCKWLMGSQFSSIICPSYLEDVLYPEMITTAVNKMKHWVHLNLRDSQRCEQFYQYYNEKSFELAIKFLWNCSNDFILNETRTIINKVSPHHFKILCEKCPRVAKIYFDSVLSDAELRSRYLDKELEYYGCLKSVLKSDPDLYLDVIEKCFNKNKFNHLSPAATKYIMNHHKSRFTKKPELYAAWLLEMKTLAECLGVEECKELVLKLARARYLTAWFSYKNVEPLIKRLVPEERAAFKKKVFAAKDIGNEVEDWPYPPPSAPIIENSGTNVYDDDEHSPNEYRRLGEAKFRTLKRRCKKYSSKYVYSMESTSVAVRTLLDVLFDEFRFASFEKTLFELRKRLGAESSSQNRQYMMLVLVSKSGGRAESIASLLQLLARHGNEPSHLRAAVVRSLVKRSCVWRLPGDTWTQLLEFARGLGLDGKTPEADCREGLHAVVMRSLLLTGECEPAVLAAYLREFSVLVEYTLTPAERQRIAELLPKILIASANSETDADIAADRINKLLDTLIAYKIRVNTYPGVIPALTALTERSHFATEGILCRLFEAKIARRELYRENFQILKKTDASYLNILRHDTGIISLDKLLELVTAGEFRPEGFLRKLAIYFSEKDGLAMRLLAILKSVEPQKKVARPLSHLIGRDLQPYLQELDKSKDLASKQLSAAIRANAHIARPPINVDTFGWRSAGAKLIANRVLICRSTEIDHHIKKLLTWKRTAKLAIFLAERTNNEAEVFAAIAVMRPRAAVKSALTYFRRRGDSFDQCVWETIKPLLQKLDLAEHTSVHLQRNVENAHTIPLRIRPEYNTIIFTAFKKISFFKSMPMLCHVELLLPDVDDKFIETVLLDFLNERFVSEESTDNNTCACLHLRILVKYLLLCKSEAIQNYRLKKVGQPFFDRIESMWETSKNNEALLTYLDEILLTFKYSKVLLNVDYVPCIPVMENVVSWMRRILPLERHFEKYVHIHLTMLYSKAIRQSIKLVPEVFEDGKRKLTEGVSAIGDIFGKYIAREANELTSKYFESVIDLYEEGLATYLQKYFYYNNITDLIAPIIKGIVDCSKGIEFRMAIYILKHHVYNLEDKVCNNLKAFVKEKGNNEMQFFLFAEMYT